MKNGLCVLALAALLSGCANLPPGLDAVLPGDAAAGGPDGTPGPYTAAKALKEALTVGTARAVERTGAPGGYWSNREIQIPLPDTLRKVEKTLRALGQGRTVDEFHLSLNRAAEAAAPEAAALFGQAIRAMSFEDALGILRGPSSAATVYFRNKTQDGLRARFHPVVALATNRVGATRKYKELAERLRAYAPGLAAEDIDAYVTERALDGLFHTLAQEEARIRRDPAARTTELLREVFARP